MEFAPREPRAAQSSGEKVCGLRNDRNSPDGEKRRFLCSGYPTMCW
jgi:hypothetical protein